VAHAPCRGLPHTPALRVIADFCKHRICPQCAYIQVKQWLNQQMARILGCDHFHVIFTIPEELRVFWHFNKNFYYRLM
jgi:hypothetical protein